MHLVHGKTVLDSFTTSYNEWNLVTQHNQRQLMLSLLWLSLLSSSYFFGGGGVVVVDDVFVDAFVVPYPHQQQHQQQRHTRNHNNRHQKPPSNSSTEMMMMMMMMMMDNNPFLLLSLNDEFDQILKQQKNAAVDVASITATGSTITDFVSNILGYVGYIFLALTVLTIVSGMIMAILHLIRFWKRLEMMMNLRNNFNNNWPII